MKKFSSVILLLFIQLTIHGVINAQIYTNGFEGGGIPGTTSFTGGATGDPNLNIAASSWSTTGSFVTFTGNAPTSTTAMALQPSVNPSTTWTLAIPVNAGHNANITGLQFDYRSTSTSYNTLSITINGTLAYFNNALNISSAWVTVPVSGLTISGITGSISVVCVLSGGMFGGSSTFRYDNFNIIGTVTGCIPPTTISGLTTVCSGLNIPLSDGSAGGVWSSNNTAVASVNSSGVVTGGTGGSAIITYATGCGTDATTTITVIPSPATITGNTFVCAGLSTILSDASAGGVWSSNNTVIANVNSSGSVTGGVGGIAAITYSTGCGANATTTVTVNTPPSGITGNTTVCSGTTSVLSDPTPRGAWSTNNTSVATVNATGVVYGVIGGFATITYSTGCGSDEIATVSVYTTPAAITGNTLICAGTFTSLSDATSAGTWSSDNTSVATIDATGTVSGISPGSSNITYTLGNAICAATATVVVNTAPSLISGPSAICAGSPVRLSDAVTGGVWSSTNSTAAVVSGTGMLTGLSAGVTNISYAIGSCTTGMTITVNAISPVTGASGSSTCPGTTITFHDATSGGIWTSDNTSVATVSGTGDITGLSGGTANISYTIGACVEIVPVAIANLGPITGNTTLCTVGATSALNDVTPGGIWSSDNTSVAIVSGIGFVSSISSGIVDITYTLGACSQSVAISVNTLLPISGPTNVCSGLTIALTDGTPGGLWSSAAPGSATVSASGVVTGVASGSAAIFYTLGSCAVGQLITVGFPVLPVSGPSSLCAGTLIALSDNTTGGTWSSDNAAVATAWGNVITGVAAGIANISYSMGNCSVSVPVTVNGADAGVITGQDTVCVGQVITLADDVAGGTWSSVTASRAAVNAAGVVTGIVGGVDTIKYTVTNICGTFTTRKPIYVLTAAQCAAGISPVTNGQLTELKVFPNPNSGTFTIDMLSDVDEEAHVIVTNIVGEKIREFTMATNKSADIRLDHIAGVYFLSAVTSHGKYVVKIVIN